jgi:hypothetical protein
MAAVVFKYKLFPFMLAGRRGLPDWRLMKTLCMPNATQESIKSTNLMKVVFHTDYYMNKTGFKGTVKIGKHSVEVIVTILYIYQ